MASSNVPPTNLPHLDAWLKKDGIEPSGLPFTPNRNYLQVPSPSSAPGIQPPMIAQHPGSWSFLPELPDNCRRCASEESFSSQSTLTQANYNQAKELDNLKARKKAFEQAIEGTSGDSYVDVLRHHAELFRSGYATNALPDNFEYKYLIEVAKILNGAAFKPEVKYTQHEILYALNSHASVFNSFQVEAVLDALLKESKINAKHYKIPEGTYSANLTDVDLNGKIEDIPSLPPSVHVLDLFNTNMTASDLDFRTFQHVKLLVLCGNNLTNNQLANNLQIPSNIINLYVDVYNRDTHKDEAPDAETLRKLLKKFPWCIFH